MSFRTAMYVIEDVDIGTPLYFGKRPANVQKLLSPLEAAIDETISLCINSTFTHAVHLS